MTDNALSGRLHPDARMALIFFIFGIFPNIALLSVVFVMSLFDVKLWTLDFSCFLGATILVMLSILAYGISLVKFFMYVGGLIQIAYLYCLVNSTGGIQGSPFSFYYLYAPSVVAVAFAGGDSRWLTLDMLEGGVRAFLRRTCEVKGFWATMFTGFCCMVVVILHICLYPLAYSPTVQRTGAELYCYNIIAFCSFFFPLILGLMVHFGLDDVLFNLVKGRHTRRNISVATQ